VKLKYFFSDFDGTLTSNGLISSDFLEFIQILKKKKIELILVSGRSASWGHFFLTHFPVKYAVMEAGGVILTQKNKVIETQVQAKVDELKLLSKVTEKMRLNFPQLELAADNVGRITDRAVELSSLRDDKIKKEVEKFLKLNKCHYSFSNVHLNYSTISNSKWTGVEIFIEKILKKSLNPTLEVSCFAGDAPNDEIMFKHFVHSVGVRNIQPYLKSMKYHPKIISPKAEIKGVLEFLNNVASV
jgi:HAD superfamily hydrolase (TIGR01484 family)